VSISNKVAILARATTRSVETDAPTGALDRLKGAPARCNKISIAWRGVAFVSRAAGDSLVTFSGLCECCCDWGRSPNILPVLLKNTCYHLWQWVVHAPARKSPRGGCFHLIFFWCRLKAVLRKTLSTYIWHSNNGRCDDTHNCLCCPTAHTPRRSIESMSSISHSCYLFTGRIKGNYKETPREMRVCPTSCCFEARVSCSIPKAHIFFQR
jgi:hypothetical protein